MDHPSSRALNADPRTFPLAPMSDQGKIKTRTKMPFICPSIDFHSNWFLRTDQCEYSKEIFLPKFLPSQLALKIVSKLIHCHFTESKNRFGWWKDISLNWSEPPTWPHRRPTRPSSIIRPMISDLNKCEPLRLTTLIRWSCDKYLENVARSSHSLIFRADILEKSPCPPSSSEG